MRTSHLVGLFLLVMSVMPAAQAFPGANGLLAFEREVPAGDHTQTDVYTVRADGTGLRRLTTTAGQNEFGPAWNAAGSRIAFWRTAAPFGPGSVWTMDPQGLDQRRLTSGFDARDPAWRPDGARIVFTRYGRDGPDLWTMRPDGSDLTPRTSGPGLDFEPAWSPDGTMIAFTRGFSDGDVGDIYLLDRVTGQVTQLTDSPAYDHQVAWGPGGQRLVFERDYPSSSAIFVVSGAGPPAVRRTFGPFFDVGPTFSPDGDSIAFGSDRSGDFLDDLWLMRVGGSDQHAIRELRYSEAFPDWQSLPGAGSR